MKAWTRVLERATAANRVSSAVDDLIRESAYFRSLLERLKDRRLTWAVVGGAPRSWAMNTTAPSDVDMAVAADPATLKAVVSEWSALFPDVELTETSFGGLRLNTPHCAIDMWPAADSVSVAKGLTTDSNTFRSVAKSAALSLDSLVWTSRGTVYDNGFFRTLQTGILTMSHCHLEQRRKVALKACRLCSTYELSPDLSLQTLIATELGAKTLDTLFRGLSKADEDGSVNPGL